MIKRKFVTTLLTICITALVSCNSVQSPSSEKGTESVSEKSNAELIQILERAESANDSAFNLFLEVTEELEKRGPSASEAAPTLAKALAYSRRDSGAAGRALISMGPSATDAIPFLLQNLDNEREDVRRYSIFNLGFIGQLAECSIPKLASLLWDEDPGVRSAAAIAIEAIAGVDLVSDDERLNPELYGSVVSDAPAGSVTQKARMWWQETGQDMKWSTDNCASVQ